MKSKFNTNIMEHMSRPLGCSYSTVIMYIDAHTHWSFDFDILLNNNTIVI